MLGQLHAIKLLKIASKSNCYDFDNSFSPLIKAMSFLRL